MRRVNVVEVAGVSKSFADIRALAGCDLVVGAGSVVGLLGPNGAGKTTLMRILAGLMQPDAGSATVLGQRPGTAGVAHRIGVTIEGPAYYPWMSGRKNLNALYAVGGPPVSRAAVDEALGRVGLADAAKRKVSGYSQGMRQRLALALALAHRPDLLILDEPANGLDPEAVTDLRRVLREERDRGAAILVSSHLLHEVELVCDSVVVIRSGRIVATRDTNSPATVTRFLVELTRGDRPAAREAFRAAGLTTSDQGVSALTVEIDSGRRAAQILGDHGLFAESVSPVRDSLEDFYLQATEEKAAAT